MVTIKRVTNNIYSPNTLLVINGFGQEVCEFVKMGNHSNILPKFFSLFFLPSFFFSQLLTFLRLDKLIHINLLFYHN